MSNFIAFDGYEDGGHEVKGSIYNALCECGHKLYMHGFVRGGDVYTGGRGFWVSQCVSCPIVDGEFVCKEFKLDED